MGVVCGRLCDHHDARRLERPGAGGRRLLEESLEEFRAGEPQALLNSKVLRLSPRLECKQLAVAEFLAGCATRTLIYNTEAVRKLYLGERADCRELFYILSKQSFGAEFQSAVAMLRALPAGVAVFSGGWELLEDADNFYIHERFAKGTAFVLELLAAATAPGPAAVAAFDRKFCELGRYKNIAPLLFLIRPAQLTWDEEAGLRVNAPLALCSLCDLRRGFAGLLFAPPEYITGGARSEQAFCFMYAAVSAFLLYDRLVYDCSKYQRLLDEEHTARLVRDGSFGVNAGFFKAALQYYPLSRKFLSLGFAKYCSEDIAPADRRAHLAVQLLNSFSLFAAEFSSFLAKFRRARLYLRENALGVTHSAHYLTIEKIYEDMCAEGDPLRLEASDELYKALKRSRKSQETCGIEEFLQVLREELLARLVLTYEVCNRKMASRPAIDLKSYLCAYSEMSEEERDELVALFQSTLPPTATA